MALLSPDPILRFCDNNNNPLVGGFLYTYQAGTSTPQATYTDSTGSTPNTNPVVLNSRGEAPVWLSPGQAYKFILQDASHNIIWTVDNINPTQSSGVVNSLTSVAGTNTITATCLGINSYSAGQVWTGIAAATNTGPVTINLNNIGPVSVTQNGVALISGEIKSGIPFQLYYNGSTAELEYPFARAITQAVGDNSTNIATTAFVQLSQFQIFPPATPTLASNAMTLGTQAMSVTFRNVALGTGGVNTIQVGALSITIPSGATLGATSGQLATLAVAMNYNAGTPVLMVCNIAGGLPLGETDLVTATTISSSATANNVWYSASAVAAGQPYRIVQRVDHTQANAGVYITAPTLVQGCGGEAFTALNSPGFGQSWQSVTRTSGTTYYNATGKQISILMNKSNGTSLQVTVNGFPLNTDSANNTVGAIPIPAGASYSINCSSFTCFECR